MKGNVMDFFIPAKLRETAPHDLDNGAAWLESLPDRAEEIARKWSLTVHRAFDADNCVSWVAPVTREDGSDAVLKIGYPHSEARYEADALRVYEGDGVARLFRVSEDGFTLLIERCLPGTNLWSLSDEKESNAVATALLQRMWREPPPESPFDTVAAIVAEWCKELPRSAPGEGYDPALVDHAIALGRELAESAPRHVLLHGDFHSSNILAAEREPWLVIDPKPLVGDPAYDLAQWLGNRYDAAVASSDPVAAIRWQVDQFSDLLGLDRTRIAGWTFVKSLGWEWGPEAARLYHQALCR